MASARLAIVTLAAGLLAAGGNPADAACPQTQAVYGAEGAEIAFAGRLNEADAMLHRFSLTFAEKDVRMDGVVMMAAEPDRPWGMVMHDCPEGDVTGAEIAACTVWQGVIYTIGSDGDAGWLPVADTGNAAGDSLLLPDFSAAVMQSRAWQSEQVTRLPGDVFRLKACRQ